MPETPRPPQVDRAAASRAAIVARRARSELKRLISEGELSALSVLTRAVDDPTGVEGRIRVTDFLLSVPAIGRTKLGRLLEELEISPSKRLGGLGRKQRDRMRDFLLAREAVTRSRRKSRLIVLAGPTAVGKGTVAAYIRENYPEITLSISATTRSPRPGEIDGVTYYFVTDEEFDRMISDDDLLEYATVHNSHRYGTPRRPINAALAQGRSLILEIDIQGARQVRRSMPDAILVFLLPPSWDELVRRLVGRGTEDLEERERRLATAKVELAAQEEFDYRVVNHTVADAAEEVVDLVRSRGPGRPRKRE